MIMSTDQVKMSLLYSSLGGAWSLRWTVSTSEQASRQLISLTHTSGCWSVLVSQLGDGAVRIEPNKDIHKCCDEPTYCSGNCWKLRYERSDCTTIFTAVFSTIGHVNLLVQFISSSAGFQEAPSASLPRLMVMLCEIKKSKFEKKRSKSTISLIPFRLNLR